MKYYTKFFDNLKGDFQNFFKIFEKDLKKSKYKLFIDLFNGIIASKSVRLSEMARKLNENILIKKTVEKLSNGLKSCDENIRNAIEKNYLTYVREYIQNDTIFAIDNSDLIKPYSKKLEALGKVRDGSTGETNVNGYFTAEAIALSKNNKEPISLVSRLYSPNDENFKSGNTEVTNMLDTLKENFGSKGIYVFDRGFDSNDNFKYFLEEKNK